MNRKRRIVLSAKNSVGVAFIGSTIVAGFCAGPAAGGEHEAAHPPTAGSISRGRILFAKHCASCHGASGAGDGSAGRDLDPSPPNLRGPEVADESDAQLFRKITRGRRPMPSFGRLLNDDDRWILAAYVKTLGNHQSRSAGK